MKNYKIPNVHYESRAWLDSFFKEPFVGFLRSLKGDPGLSDTFNKTAMHCVRKNGRYLGLIATAFIGVGGLFKEQLCCTKGTIIGFDGLFKEQLCCTKGMVEESQSFFVQCGGVELEDLPSCSSTSSSSCLLAPVRSLAMQWSFSNKAPTIPRLLSFQDVHEEIPKTGFDSLASTGLVSITTIEAFDSDHSPYSNVMHSSVLQKNIVPEKQAGPWYRMTTHPAKQLDSRTMNQSILNQENVTVSPVGLHLIGSASPQPLAGISMAHPFQAIPSSSPVMGTTDLRNIPKISTAPAQLTIFYAGSVCVYDNISPQKAQAIMLLAGNGPPTHSSTTLPIAPVQATMPQSSVLDGFVVSQPYGSTPYHSGHIPITALCMSGSVGGSAINNRTTVNPGVTLPCSSKIEPMKVVKSLGSDPANATLPSSSVPQFRRKSLARFLEKRKERVIAQGPYNTDQQTLDKDTPEGPANFR